MQFSITLSMARAHELGLNLTLEELSIHYFLLQMATSAKTYEVDGEQWYYITPGYIQQQMPYLGKRAKNGDIITHSKRTIQDKILQLERAGLLEKSPANIRLRMCLYRFGPMHWRLINTSDPADIPIPTSQKTAGIPRRNLQGTSQKTARDQYTSISNNIITGDVSEKLVNDGVTGEGLPVEDGAVNDSQSSSIKKPKSQAKGSGKQELKPCPPPPLNAVVVYAANRSAAIAEKLGRSYMARDVEPVAKEEAASMHSYYTNLAEDTGVEGYWVDSQGNSIKSWKNKWVMQWEKNVLDKLSNARQPYTPKEISGANSRKGMFD